MKTAGKIDAASKMNSSENNTLTVWAAQLLTQKHSQFSCARHRDIATGDKSINHKSKYVWYCNSCYPWNRVVCADVKDAEMQHVVHVFGERNWHHVVGPIGKDLGGYLHISLFLLLDLP